MSFPPEKCELGGGASELAFALATCVYDLREHVRFAQDQNLVGAELDLGSPVLREDDLVALGDVHLDVLPVLVPPTGADGQHAAALRLLPRRVRQNNPAHRQLFLIKNLDDQTVTKRLQIHKASFKVSIGLSSNGFCGELPRGRGRPLLARTSREAYASAATPFVTDALLDSQAITGPAVIVGVFGSAPSSFCSRTHCAASRVDSCACAELSNSPTEVRTPPPASIR